jgi:hypothetical protein
VVRGGSRPRWGGATSRAPPPALPPSLPPYLPDVLLPQPFQQSPFAVLDLVRPRGMPEGIE